MWCVYVFSSSSAKAEQKNFNGIMIKNHRFLHFKINNKLFLWFMTCTICKHVHEDGGVFNKYKQMITRDSHYIH